MAHRTDRQEDTGRATPDRTAGSNGSESGAAVDPWAGESDWGQAAPLFSGGDEEFDRGWYLEHSIAERRSGDRRAATLAEQQAAAPPPPPPAPVYDDDDIEDFPPPRRGECRRSVMP